jgi:uncharacterized protein (DUF488 family)
MKDSAKHAVFTIGHSTHSLESFAELLRRHGVTTLADVRSAPYSRFNPQFNREALERNLRAHGISYLFLGRELGARPDDPSCYENGRVIYERLARTERFHNGIEIIINGATDRCIALMCAEKEPLECHRTLLVARVLDKAGIRVKHILADGSLQTHDETMQRLLHVVGLPQEDLFRSRDELIAEALARQEKRVAYVDEAPAQAARHLP